MFQTWFERSADAIWLYDPQAEVFVDCNQAAVELMRAGTKERLLQVKVEDLSPPTQPDGTRSGERTAEIIAMVREHGSLRFEWVARRFDGTEFPVEVLATPIPLNGRDLHVIVSRDITERKRHEAELLESQRLLASVTDNLSEAIYRSGPDHKLIFVNQAYLKLFGYDSLAELESIPRDHLYADPEARRQLLEMLARNDSFRHQELEYVRRDGSRFWGLSSARIIRDQQTGEVSYQVGAISDITEHKKDEAEIRRLNQSLERARNEQMHRHRDVLLELAQMDKSDFRQAIGKICARSAEALDVARVSYWSLVEENSAILCEHQYSKAADGPDRAAMGARLGAEVCPAYFEALGNRRPIVAGNVLTHPATACLAENYLKPLGITSMLDVPVWVRGQVVGVVCHEHVGPMREWTAEETDFVGGLATMVSQSLEESQRAKSERLLRESEARFSAAFRASPVFIAITSLPDGRYVLANEAFLNWGGYSREEVLGHNSAELSVWADPADRERFWEDLRRVRCIRERECRFRNRYGVTYTMLLSADIIELDNVPHVLAMALDITQRKLAEAELLKSLAREKELGQLKSNFVSMVSHEFRTPLGIIQSSAEILGDYYDRLEEAERREQLASIVKNTRRMAVMMEEILVLSRLDAGKMDFKPAGVKLDVFCRRVVDEVLSATNARCPIHVSLGALPGRAWADEGLLAHIFTNLLVNAVKYSEAGAPVSFAVRADGPDAMCTVRDRGIGIPAKDQQWLFNPFQRGSNVGERAGTGLGLVLVKRCVELHGGTIKLESKIGEGTTVMVRLPLFGTRL